MFRKSDDLRNGGVAGPVDGWEERDFGRKKRKRMKLLMFV